MKKIQCCWEMFYQNPVKHFRVIRKLLKRNEEDINTSEILTKIITMVAKTNQILVSHKII